MAADAGSKREARPTAAREARPAQGLHLVATPIGNSRDVTLRALDALAGAEVIAAEDTRRTRQLMDLHGIALGGRELLSYNDHNAPRVRPRLLARLREGASVALATDAGTPLVADPGWRLAREALAEGLAVHALPGPCAAIAALTVSGLPSDRFLFAGFPPTRAGERGRWLAELASAPATLILYESPRRLAELLAAMREALGEREAAVCRELTKLHEEVRRGPLSTLAAAYAGAPAPRGEAVVLVGPPAPAEADQAAVDAALREALATLSVRDAATEVARRLGAPRRAVYARALELAK